MIRGCLDSARRLGGHGRGFNVSSLWTGYIGDLHDTRVKIALDWPDGCLITGVVELRIKGGGLMRQRHMPGQQIALFGQGADFGLKRSSV